MFLGAYEMLDRFISCQESGVVDLAMAPANQDENSITIVFGALTQYWLSGSLPAPESGPGGNVALKLHLHRAVENGFQWIAMVLAERMKKR